MAKVTRRDVVKATAAVVAAAAAPIAMGSLIRSASLQHDFEKAISEFRRARAASRLARPRILKDVRRRGFGAYFNSPEIKARAAARQTAQALAEQIFIPAAANDAERLLQEVALEIYESELGGSPGARERFPPGRRAVGQLSS
jgi:hypothetical protein